MTDPHLSPKAEAYEFISCPKCKARYRIPRTKTALKLTCSRCHSAFYKRAPMRRSTKRAKYLLSAGALLLITMIILLAQFSRRETQGTRKTEVQNNNGESKLVKPTTIDQTSSNWITISYAGLVDGSVLTHSGETVSKVIQKIPSYEDALRGLVQQYLEPYSFLCNDVVYSISEVDSIPLVNITSYYPVGTLQPAWASLFRQGHYQLYFNPHLIRIFLKGTNSQQSFYKHRSVVRHAILEVLQRQSSSIERLEVYAFENDYAKMEIRLSTVPAVFGIEALELSPGNTAIDLASIDDFLKEGVILEAVEVDPNNDLYFYGRKALHQTIAGFPVSLSDIAVIYRSIFHYGDNSPYISLDKHEDNRFAKVNFGGHLENTRVGHVVLEADKLFKTIGTGLHPNTHRNMRPQIARHVSDFLTEDERSLLEGNASDRQLIRYWFYPDSIGTVTDGSIGAILSNQFFAEVERMDVKANVSTAIRNTINHLNRHFTEYENANDIYKELSTVGRIMALVNWLSGMNLNQRLDLDEFLSVPIPAFITPVQTKKLLAVTAISYPKYSPPSVANVRSHSRVFYLSSLLDHFDPATTDEWFIQAASRYVRDNSDFAFPSQKQLQSTVDRYEPLIKNNETRILSLERDIDLRKRTLDNNNEHEIDSYNDLIARYNALIQTQKSYINTYNDAVQQLNNLQIQTYQIASIGGGISLSPKKFKLISRDISSP